MNTVLTMSNAGVTALQDRSLPPLPRCIVCTSQVAKPSDRLCRSCRAWALLGEHVVRGHRLAKIIEEGRDDA